MNKKNGLFIFLLVILLIIPIIVNAETEYGTLEPSWEGWKSNNYYSEYSTTGGTPGYYNYITFVNIEYTTDLKSFIHFDKAGDYHPTFNGIFSSNNSINNIPFRAYVDGNSALYIGSGTFGYQRNFVGFPATEIGGYQYWLFDDWNSSVSSGEHMVEFRYLFPENGSSNIVYPAYFSYHPVGDLPIGYAHIEDHTYNTPLAGNYTFNRDLSFLNSYIATRPSGIGIAGNVTKNVSGATPSPSRVYIINASSGQVLTSESNVGITKYSFTVLDIPIKIAVFASTGDWYNTSTLFSGGGLPTPTPTPTVTYPPNLQYYNATFIVKNGLNNSVLANVYTELQINANQAVQGYTNSSGMITFNLVSVGSNQIVRLTKSGYQNSQYTYPQPVYGDSIRTVYMYPDVGGNPTTPTNINITVQVKDSNGNQPINQAYVTIRDTIAGTPEQGAYTNSSGYVVFQHFPNTAYIDGIISKSGYTQYNWHPDYAGIQTGDITVLRYLLGSAQPTPTLPSYDTWTLTANPASILLGNSAVLTADCSNSTKESYPTLQTVLYYDNNNLGAYSSPVLIGTYHYNTSSSHWNYKDKNGVWNYSYASYNPLSLYVTPDTSGTHTYSVYTFGAGNYPYTTSTDLGTAQTEVVVTGAGAGGSLTMNLFAIDGATTSHLQDYGLVLTNTITGQSNIYNVSYDVNVNLPRGAQMRLEGDKEGYNHGSVDFTVPTDINIVAGTFGAMKGVNLFPYGSYIVGNVTVTVHVDDAETYYPLSNVAVYMTGSLAPKYTGTQGESVSFIMPENYPFTVRAVKDGYCSVSDAKNTSQASNGYLYVPLFMKFGNCAGVTPTHTPIGNITPTITPTLPYGNQGNATAGTCSSLNWTSNTSWFDKMRGLLACNNVPDLLTQNLIIACGLIIVIAAIGAKYAKGIGFAVGSILGAVIAMGLGLIPFWMIAVLIVACIAIILSKTILTSGG